MKNEGMRQETDEKSHGWDSQLNRLDSNTSELFATWLKSGQENQVTEMSATTRGLILCYIWQTDRFSNASVKAQKNKLKKIKLKLWFSE